MTEFDSKPAVPFGPLGGRIVDFVMAALSRAGFPQLMVATQYRPESLVGYLERVWASAFPAGLLLRDGRAFATGYRGTADVLLANLPEIVQLAPRYVMVLAGDHVLGLDLAAFLSAHIESGAAVTVAATPVPLADASGFGIFGLDPVGRARTFHEKPALPQPMPGVAGRALASMGIYVFDLYWLMRSLPDQALRPGTRHDFGCDIMPRALAEGELHVHVQPTSANGRPGYWRDVGTLDAYRRSQIEFSADAPPLPLPRPPGRPAALRWPTRDDALFESVALPGARLGRGCRVWRGILGPGVQLPDGMVVGEDPDEDARWFRRSEGGTTLVTRAMLERRAALRGRPSRVRVA